MNGASRQHLPPPFGKFESPGGDRHPSGTTWRGKMARLSQQHYGANRLITATFVQAQNRGTKNFNADPNPKIIKSIALLVNRLKCDEKYIAGPEPL